MKDRNLKQVKGEKEGKKGRQGHARKTWKFQTIQRRVVEEEIEETLNERVRIWRKSYEKIRRKRYRKHGRKTEILNKRENSCRRRKRRKLE